MVQVSLALAASEPRGEGLEVKSPRMWQCHSHGAEGQTVDREQLEPTGRTVGHWSWRRETDCGQRAAGTRSKKC